MVMKIFYVVWIGEGRVYRESDIGIKVWRWVRFYEGKGRSLVCIYVRNWVNIWYFEKL